MKKSKIKLLTATACLALVGTASAAWVYAGTATASASIGVKVASYASAGTITVNGAENINVLLDKSSVTFVRDSESDTLTAKHNVPSEFSSESRSVTKTFKVAISSTLATYVTFSSSVNYEKDDDTGTLTTTDTYTWTDDNDVYSSLPGLTYAADMTPSSQQDYWNLINHFKSNTIDGDNWDNVMNKEWNVTTDLNSDAYVQIIFSAVVPNA